MAFNRSSLTSITIPDSVTGIGDRAFSYCSSLESINVSENNENYSDIDGVLFNKDKSKLISYPASKSDFEYIIPDSVTIIETYVFCGCSSLKSITIPEGVTSIGGYAFSHCSSLESITILNPDCEITNYAYTICTGYDENYNFYFNGTIYGYEGSTAQTYAENWNYNFVAIQDDNTAETLVGDSNGDGQISLADAVAILQYVANPEKYPLSEQGLANADVYNKGDGITGMDALAIQMYDFGQIDFLPYNP